MLQTSWGILCKSKDIPFSDDIINEGVLILLDDITDQLINVICSSNG
jgi:hypothetical protein